MLERRKNVYSPAKYSLNLRFKSVEQMKSYKQTNKRCCRIYSNPKHFRYIFTCLLFKMEFLRYDDEELVTVVIVKRVGNGTKDSHFLPIYWRMNSQPNNMNILWLLFRRLITLIKFLLLHFQLFFERIILS